MKLGKIPLRPEDADRLAWLVGPRTRHERQKYVDFVSLLTPAVRGARVTGLRGYLETAARGGNEGQAQEGALKDVLNSQIHPLAGPPVQALGRALLGKDLYITRMRDDRGRPTVQLLDSVREKAQPGSSGAQARVLSALRSVNQIVDRGVGLAEGEEGASLGRSLSEIVAPRVFARTGDPAAERRRLARERAAMHRK